MKKDRGIKKIREVYCADSLLWLKGKKFKAVITSLPDMSELKISMASYTVWLTKAAEVLMNCIDENGCIIFYQTNRKFNGSLIDKEFLISSVFFPNGYKKVFQKIVLRKKPGVTDLYRPSFSNMFCFSKKISSGPGGPDVVYAGQMITPCAIGLAACEIAIDFIHKKVNTDTILDPFCGAGTVLTVANQKGFKAIGVEIDKLIAAKARKITIPIQLNSDRRIIREI